MVELAHTGNWHLQFKTWMATCRPSLDDLHARICWPDWMWKNLHYVWCMAWLPGPFVIDWYYRSGTQKSSGQPVQNVHGLCFFPPNVITTRPNHSQRINRQLLLQQLFAGTKVYLHSFVPHILFMCGTCFLSRLLIYLCSILRVILLTIVLTLYIIRL